MNGKIKEEITEQLEINSDNKSFSEKIKVLDDQIKLIGDRINKLDNLVSSMGEIKIDLRKKRSHELMEKWYKDIIDNNLCDTLKIEGDRIEDSHSFRVELKEGVKLGVWDGDDNKSPNFGYYLYWGFTFTSTTSEDFKKAILRIIEENNLEPEASDDLFIAWGSTEKGADDFKGLYKTASGQKLIK